MLRQWWSKLRGMLTGRQAIGEDLRAELDAHLEMEIEQNIARGLPPEEARAAARRHIGNLTRIEERARDAWSWRWLETTAQDLRYALRGIRRAPGFALVVTLTLALGIGANTAIFSVVNTVLLRPLPYPAAERLVQLGEWDPQAEGISVTWVNYQHWRSENHSFEEMAGMHTAHLTLTGHGEAALTRAATVTSGFFGLTGAKPLLGRVFSGADDRPGAPLTAVLSYQFWAGKLGAGPHIVGTTLTLNSQPYIVLGVLPPQFKFYEQSIDLYLPLYRMQGDIADRSAHGSMRLLARLKPGVTLRAAMADLNALMRHLAEADPGPESQHRAYGAFLADERTHDVRPTLLILLAAAGLVLIIACANVASLLLARGTVRAQEIAIRAAIGAGRARLTRQLLVENLVLAALGGIAGSLLAQWGVRALIAMGPREIPRLGETTFDARVLLFAAVITLATALVTGLAPIFAAAKQELISVLKDSTRWASSRGGNALRSGLVVAEIALTMVLAFAASLLLRNLISAQTSNPGYDPEHVLALELVLPSSSYRSAEAIQNFYGGLRRDLRGLPGVTDVGAVNCPPSVGDCGDWFYSILDRAAPQPAEVPIALFNTADRDYFGAMRIPLREGRRFTEHDPPRVVIVNETFARKWWPRGSAVGGRIKWGGPYRDGPVYQIVGVVGDVAPDGLGDRAVSGSLSAIFTIVVRGHGCDDSLRGRSASTGVRGAASRGGHRWQFAHPELAALRRDRGRIARPAAFQYAAIGAVRGPGDGFGGGGHLRSVEPLGARAGGRDCHPHGFGRAAAIDFALGGMAGFAIVHHGRRNRHTGSMGCVAMAGQSGARGSVEPAGHAGGGGRGGHWVRHGRGGAAGMARYAGGCSKQTAPRVTKL